MWKTFSFPCCSVQSWWSPESEVIIEVSRLTVILCSLPGKMFPASYSGLSSEHANCNQPAKYSARKFQFSCLSVSTQYKLNKNE